MLAFSLANFTISCLTVFSESMVITLENNPAYPEKKEKGKDSLTLHLIYTPHETMIQLLYICQMSMFSIDIINNSKLGHRHLRSSKRGCVTQC